MHFPTQSDRAGSFIFKKKKKKNIFLNIKNIPYVPKEPEHGPRTFNIKSFCHHIHLNEMKLLVISINNALVIV